MNFGIGQALFLRLFDCLERIMVHDCLCKALVTKATAAERFGLKHRCLVSGATLLDNPSDSSNGYAVDRWNKTSLLLILKFQNLAELGRQFLILLQN